MVDQADVEDAFRSARVSITFIVAPAEEKPGMAASIAACTASVLVMLPGNRRMEAATARAGAAIPSRSVIVSWMVSNTPAASTRLGRLAKAVAVAPVIVALRVTCSAAAKAITGAVRLASAVAVSAMVSVCASAV